MQKTKANLTIQGVEAQIDGNLPTTEGHYAISVYYGDRPQKKQKSKTPSWSEPLELSIQTDKEIPPLQIRISFRAKKINGKKVPYGSSIINLELNPKITNPHHQELNVDLCEAEKLTGKLKLKLVLTGLSAKARKFQVRRNSRREAKPPIFDIIKECSREKTIDPLREFLKTATPEDVNVKLPRSGNSPLHEACIEKAEQLLNALLQFPGIDVNIKNRDENTPLHYFCEKWTSPDYLTSFNLFIKQGAKVDAFNSNGETPIFKAIFNNSIRALLMEALIEKGANLNFVTQSRDGLLHYAVRLNRADLVRLILQNRPSLDINKEGETPEGLAIQLNGSASIRKYLQQIGELFKWLDENDLSEWKGLFVKNEIDLSLLPDMTDSLLNQMGVDKVGVRIKILKACEKEKESSKTRAPKTALPKKEELSDSVLDSLQEDLHLNTQAGGKGVLDGTLLEYTKHLGTGAAGDVYKGLYEGNVVAIKVLSVKSQEKEVEEFKKEFEILKAVRHTNVVYFFGVAMKPHLCMVMEFCARGSLHHVVSDPAGEIGWARAISFCKQMTAGLKALHQNNPVILHRDLKSLNLLVSQDWVIKIADFGLSRFNTVENLETIKQMRGTYQYLDPEVYNGAPFKPPSDIYSMAVIFWELVMRVITGNYQQPYGEFKNLQFDFQIIIQSAKEDLRPTIHPNCPPLFKNLIVRCWHKAQVERPTLDQIAQSLDEIQETYQSSPQEWDSLKKIGS